jgi:hypothetical protein
VIVGFLGRLRGALGSAEVLISQAIFFECSEASQTIWETISSPVRISWHSVPSTLLESLWQRKNPGPLRQKNQQKKSLKQQKNHL